MPAVGLQQVVWLASGSSIVQNKSRITGKMAHAIVWNNLGIVYDELNRYDDAIDAYRESLRINPENASAWTVLVIAYYLSGNNGAAMDALKELRRLDVKMADRLFDILLPR